MQSPLPDNPLMHCVLVFDSRTQFVPLFLDSFRRQFPGADTDEPNWTALPEPRPCVFGPLAWQQWKWHLLIDFRGLPPQVADILLKANMAPETRSVLEHAEVSAMIFLIDVPEEATEQEMSRMLIRPAWSMLDAGADVLIWPRTGLAWHRYELEDQNCDDFDPSFRENVDS